MIEQKVEGATNTFFFRINVDDFFLSGINPTGAVLSRIETVQEFRSHSGHADGRLLHPGPVHLRLVQIHGERQSKLQKRLLYTSLPFIRQPAYAPHSHRYTHIRSSSTPTLPSPNEQLIIKKNK